MTNIEKDNIEKDRTWNIESNVNKKSESSEKFELSKLKAEIISSKEKQEAEKIVSWLSWIKKEKSQEAPKTQTNIYETIQSLNRPEAQKGIEQSYMTIDTTIKNSKNDSGIAGVLGKIMNRINP